MKHKKVQWLTLLMLIVAFLLPQATVHAADGSSLERVENNGELVVGTSADFPPYEFIAEVDGEEEFVGMDIMIAEKIAEDLGVELNVVDMDFDALLPALEVGQVDMVIAGLTPTEERQQSVDFSDVYYQSTQNITVRADDADIYDSKESLVGERVGVQMGSLQEELIEQIPDAQPYRLGNLNDLLLALQTNQIEAVIMQSENAEAHATINDSLHTFDGDFDLEEQELGSAIAVRPGETSLLEAINESLAEIEENNLAEEYLEYSAQYMETVDPGFFGFIANYWGNYASGIGITLLISAVGILVGMIIGFILALMRISTSKPMKFTATSYVEFVRGTPLMIQVMTIYFGISAISDFNLPALAAGLIAVSLNCGAYVCEIIRSGISSIPTGQTEASRSLGMNRKDTMRYIIFPQALKNIWPALGNEFITIIKESSIVSVIGVSELIFQTRNVRSASFRGVLPLFITLILYFVLTFSLSKLLNFYEGRMNYDNR